jgi:hypothetical protein
MLEYVKRFAFRRVSAMHKAIATAMPIKPPLIFQEEVGFLCRHSGPGFQDRTGCATPVFSWDGKAT